MQRRNLLIGLGALGFGSSKFIASGAFGGDQDGSRGNWVQTSEIDGSTSGDVRVQTIADLDNTDHRFQALGRDEIGVSRSSIIQEDDSGFLQHIAFESVNLDSTTRVGRLARQGIVDPGNVAFIIANLGGVETETRGEPVELHLRLYDGTPTDESSVVQPNGAVKFHYTIPERGRSGDLLQESGVVVDPRELLCVAVEVNARGTETYDRIESVGLRVRQPTNE
ncbi:hypothetical protein [Halostagnicola sp. A-GB9-2]|uniref:hypothetical protein n=1 Tax=Halostagnicola sp. A-GB9-2 TaxID=3048066 RepID=UPI0024C0397F|nr:hypothetical protein [Halostagnicola sp. A-GB9-2]MDJ1433729.1 hypothetical protein [Halostagnicola sp. A-GB9-2]